MSYPTTLTGISVVESFNGKPMVAVATEALRVIIEVGRERDYNRKLGYLDGQIDPDGVHILSPEPTEANIYNPNLPLGYHDRAQGQPAPPHIRCACWIKLRHQRKAERATVDVPIEYWPKDMRLVDGRRRWTVPVEELRQRVAKEAP